MAGSGKAHMRNNGALLEVEELVMEFPVGGGRVAEVFIGECDGFTSATLSPEEIRDNWGQITDREGYTVPAHMGDETALFVRALS